MKFIITGFVVLLICASIALCDGPPMDSLGNPTTYCYYVTLSKEQIDQVGRTRVLTLSKQQWNALRSHRFPRTIDVVTRSWAICTCDLIYCIWFTETKVAIPRSFFDDTTCNEGSYQKYSPDASQAINIDCAGKLYYHGSLLYEKNLKSDIIAMAKDHENAIWVSFPPLLKKSRERVIQYKVAMIKKICEDSLIEMFYA
jgi:hypothetical protein